MIGYLQCPHQCGDIQRGDIQPGAQLAHRCSGSWGWAGGSTSAFCSSAEPCCWHMSAWTERSDMA
jgi:hypothetical protein